MKALVRRALSFVLGPVIRNPFIQEIIDRYVRDVCAGMSISKDNASGWKELLFLFRILSVLYPRPYYRVTEIENGCKIAVDVSDLLGLRLFYHCPTPDMFELKLITQLVTEGDVCIDAGANIGLYTLTMAKCAGNSGHVYSFEPSPHTFNILSGNIALNTLPQVTLNHQALSNTSGNAELYVTAESGLTSFADNGRGTLIEKVSVPTLSLDSYVSKHSITDVRFLKIDVEGFEKQVLTGAEQLLRSSQNLILMVELDDRNLVPLGCSAREMLALLRDMGYDAWLIDRDQKKLVPVEYAHPQTGVNFIFSRPKNPRFTAMLG